MAVERPRGTRDFTPEEMRRRAFVEKTLRGVVESFNYGEVLFPAFEHTQLFQMKSGEEISGHMYVFEDKGGRSLCLRPEATASVARMFGSSLRNMQRPVKVYYMAPMYRYEEPQKNRYREFWQFGLELIGPDTRESDAEAILIAAECLKKLGIEHEVEVSHLGILRSLLEDFGLDEKQQDHAIACLDRKSHEELRKTVKEEVLFKLMELKGSIEVLEKAGKLLAGHMGSLESLNELRETALLLDCAGVEYSINLGMARGLAYYTGVIFEIRVPDLGAQNQICGGGRYDNLIKLFSGVDEPAVGFAFGFDRVLDALEQQNIPIPEGAAVVVVASAGEEAGKKAFEIANKLRRDCRLRVEFDLMNRKLGRALEYASKIKARYAVIVGQKELAVNKVIVRDMSKGTQADIELDRLQETLKQ